MNDRCERWHLKLQSYYFTIKHIEGTSNTMPDYLSCSLVGHAIDDTDDEGYPNPMHSAILSNTFDNELLPTSSIVNSITTHSHT